MKIFCSSKNILDIHFYYLVGFVSFLIFLQSPHELSATNSKNISGNLSNLNQTDELQITLKQSGQTYRFIADQVAIHQSDAVGLGRDDLIPGPSGYLITPKNLSENRNHRIIFQNIRTQKMEIFEGQIVVKTKVSTQLQSIAEKYGLTLEEVFPRISVGFFKASHLSGQPLVDLLSSLRTNPSVIRANLAFVPERKVPH